MISVILPCYKSKNHILEVLCQLGKEVSEIIVVDDACPQGTGKYVEEHFHDDRLKVLFHKTNKGVGGAMKTGFAESKKGKCSVFVKIDSDGQMPPVLIPKFVAPILEGRADYCKGNRFYNVESLKDMPLIRIVGNAGLSFLTKLSSGYWNTMDPTNGFLAIHRNIIENIPLDKVSNRFFFETDMLFRANIIGALVLDIPMHAVYNKEKSNLSIGKSLLSFPFRHIGLFIKRIFYNYFLRDFSVATINLVVGCILFLTGMIYGFSQYLHNSQQGIETPVGVQVITLIQLLVGFQMLLSFINYDISRIPKTPITPLLPEQSVSKK